MVSGTYNLSFLQSRLADIAKIASTDHRSPFRRQHWCPRHHRASCNLYGCRNIRLARCGNHHWILRLCLSVWHRQCCISMSYAHCHCKLDSRARSDRRQVGIGVFVLVVCDIDWPESSQVVIVTKTNRRCTRRMPCRRFRCATDTGRDIDLRRFSAAYGG
jgi:hypothetical protein